MNSGKKNRAVIFDFDGTICYLFSHFDLRQAGKQMEERMKEYSIDFAYEGDLFAVFDAIEAQTESGQKRTEALMAAEKILAGAETEAAGSTDFVSGAKKMLLTLLQAGIPVGIATNNAPESVLTALGRIGIPSVPVTGRIPGHPEKLKPDPDSLQRVLVLMNASKEDAVFIGDTIRDLRTAENFGIPFIAIGSTKRKFSRLAAQIPESEILKTLHELPSALEKLALKEENGCRSLENTPQSENI